MGGQGYNFGIKLSEKEREQLNINDIAQGGSAY